MTKMFMQKMFIYMYVYLYRPPVIFEFIYNQIMYLKLLFLV